MFQLMGVFFFCRARMYTYLEDKLRWTKMLQNFRMWRLNRDGIETLLALFMAASSLKITKQSQAVKQTLLHFYLKKERLKIWKKQWIIWKFHMQRLFRFFRIIYSNGNNRWGLIINYMEIVLKKITLPKILFYRKKRRTARITLLTLGLRQNKTCPRQRQESPHRLPRQWTTFQENQNSTKIWTHVQQRRH